MLFHMHPALEWVVLICVVNRDPTHVGEFVYRRLAPEAAVARAFDSAKRHLGFIGNCGAVYVADPRFEAGGDIEGALHVA